MDTSLLLLDHQSFTPLYYQLAEHLRTFIDERLSAGDRIPSENDLAAQYHISRNTVRQAIDLLIHEGVVYRKQGKGTFVAPHNMRYRLQKLVSFSEDMRRRGYTPDSKLLAFEKQIPPPKIGMRLGLFSFEEAYHFIRLRLADGEPMALSSTFLPAKLFPDLDEQVVSGGSLFHLLENRSGLRLGYADRSLKATVADEQQAHLLKIRPGEPLMHMEGTTYLEDNTPIEFVSIFYRGDRYEFSYQAIRNHH